MFKYVVWRMALATLLGGMWFSKGVSTTLPTVSPTMPLTVSPSSDPTGQPTIAPTIELAESTSQKCPDDCACEDDCYSTVFDCYCDATCVSQNQCCEDTCDICGFCTGFLIWVMSPDGTVSYGPGNTMLIQWKASGLSSDYVQIKLIHPSGTQVVLAELTSAATGFFIAQLDSDLKTDEGYFVRVLDYGDLNFFNQSSTFNIQDPFLRVITPTGDNVYDLGDKMNISWTYGSLSGENIAIHLVKGRANLPVQTFEEDFPASKKEYESPTLENLPSGENYQILLMDAQRHEIQNYSDYLTIGRPLPTPPPTSCSEMKNSRRNGCNNQDHLTFPVGVGIGAACMLSEHQMQGAQVFHSRRSASSRDIEVDNEHSTVLIAS